VIDSLTFDPEVGNNNEEDVNLLNALKRRKVCPNSGIGTTFLMLAALRLLHRWALDKCKAEIGAICDQSSEATLGNEREFGDRSRLEP
jgi:hypothetical protein